MNDTKKQKEHTGNFLLTHSAKKILAVIGFLGAVVFAYGLFKTPTRVWLNLLLDNFFFISISITGMVFLAIHYVPKAGWHTILKRVPESMTSYLPAGALFMVVLIFGLHHIYPWTHHNAVIHDHILSKKTGYLNIPFYLIRMFIYIGLWYWMCRKLVKNSLEQDKSTDPVYAKENVRLSAIFLVIFAITLSLASIDSLMSLEPHWFSTIYPWYTISSVFVSALCMITLLVILLRRNGFLQDVRASHLHDMGKYIFSFSIFWGYLWFSQYLLIWYSNIPEESIYYEIRTSTAGWNILFWLNLAVNLLLPFFLLLPKANKKNEKLMMSTCVILLIGHWLDIYILVMPSFMKSGPGLGLYEAGMFLGFLSVFLLLFDRSFRRHPEVPVNDPYLIESLHHHS